MSTSTEEVLVADPEIIIISKGSMAEACGLTPATIKGRSDWSEVSAVKNNQIYEVDESILSREGPRLILALEQLAKAIHPELFENV